VIELHIDEPCPSLNYVWGGHWHKKHELRKKWLWLIRQARLKAKVYDPPRHERAAITITRYGKRHVDQDNLAGGAKVIFDSLKQEGFIVDDSPKHITATYVQHVGQARGTVIRIEAA
jgi:hypothetical protein